MFSKGIIMDKTFRYNTNLKVTQRSLWKSEVGMRENENGWHHFLEVLSIYAIGICDISRRD